MDTYPYFRPWLFKLDAETAHYTALQALNAQHTLFSNQQKTTFVPPISLMGINLPNPIGLAAGLDKNGDYIHALDSLGFGFIEVGTITPRPQDGNPKPRLFRVPENQAIINRMGFNNKGIDYLIERVKNVKRGIVLGINIGKNATTPIENAADDYLICLEKAYEYASYITINISSPNTKNLRDLQGGDELSKLLGCLKNRQAQLHSQHRKYVPLAVKIAPDLDENQIDDIAKIVAQTEIDGVIATNTTIDKTALGNNPLANEQGGLSGDPVREKSNAVLKSLREKLDTNIPIIGAGGVLSGSHAAEKMRLGANAVQIYSGLIYRGPQLVQECVNAVEHFAR